MSESAAIYCTLVAPASHMVSGGYTLVYPDSVRGLAAALRAKRRKDVPI
jgi:hypothetical protein